MINSKTCETNTTMLVCLSGLPHSESMQTTRWLACLTFLIAVYILLQCQVEAVALFACLTPRDVPTYMKMVTSGILLTFLFCNVIGRVKTKHQYKNDQVVEKAIYE